METQGNRRIVPCDGAEAARALNVHMLNELVRIRADIAATRRLCDYTARRVGYDPNSPDLQLPLQLDCAGRAIEAGMRIIEDWLKAQVIGLYDQETATRYMLDERERDTPPRTYE